MIQTFDLFPGITLHCVQDDRFKQGCLSIQFLRQMTRDEAPYNALIPAVLLRGTAIHKDLRDITLKLDDLYGASVSALVRRVGDYQTTGLYCGFMEDRFALSGDEILAPMIDFLGELLFQPLTENGGFCHDFVESEKRNLILTIESEINDKRAYAAGRLLKLMCRDDSFGIPRLGEKPQAEAMDGKLAYAHYQQLLRESPVMLFYVGSAQGQQVAALLKDLFSHVQRAYRPLPPQSAFHDAGGENKTEEMDVSQAKLCMGFVTPISNRSEQFAAMQVCNTVFGGGMTSKLFMNLREKMSLCYYVGSGYYGVKGLMTVNAGIDADKEEISRNEILRQLSLCQQGEISQEELQNAKEALLSALQGIHDSPGAIENYYNSQLLGGFPMDVDTYAKAIAQVTVADVAEAAQSLRFHSSFVLKGVSA